jgi:hypothetical protein
MLKNRNASSSEQERQKNDFLKKMAEIVRKTVSNSGKANESNNKKGGNQ